MSPVEVGNHFADIRFVRLSAIKNIGDSLSGSWAPIGVLLEKGALCTSSSGKPYIICKIGSSCQRKPMQQGEHISIEGLMKALSKADKVTTTSYSQGIRFLSHVTTDGSKILAKNRSENATRNLRSQSQNLPNSILLIIKGLKPPLLKLGRKGLLYRIRSQSLNEKRHAIHWRKRLTLKLLVQTSDEEYFWSI